MCVYYSYVLSVCKVRTRLCPISTVLHPKFSTCYPCGRTHAHIIVCVAHTPIWQLSLNGGLLINFERQNQNRCADTDLSRAKTALNTLPHVCTIPCVRPRAVAAWCVCLWFARLISLPLIFRLNPFTYFFNFKILS